NAPPEPAPAPRPRSRALPWAFALTLLVYVYAIVGSRSAARPTRKLDTAVAPVHDAMNIETPKREGMAASYWRIGMQLYRDGALEAAAADFERATQTDPHFAPAHLGAILVSNPYTTASLREHARLANEYRYMLTE